MPRHRERSCGVFVGGSPPAIREQVTHEIEARQLIAHPLAELRSRHEYEPGRRLDEDEGRALGEAGTLAHVGGHDNATAISHHNRVRPTHVPIVPRALS
jgi:hypothetical protein